MKTLTLTLGLLLMGAVLGCTSPTGTPRATDNEVPLLEDPYAFLEAQSKARWAEPRRTRFNIDYRPINGLQGRAAWHVTTENAPSLWPVFINRDIEELDKSKVHEVDAIAFNDDFQGLKLYVYGYKAVGEAPHPVADPMKQKDGYQLEAVRRVMRSEYMKMKSSWVPFSWPAHTDMTLTETETGKRWVVHLDTSDKPGGIPEQLIVDVTHAGGHTGIPKVEINPYAAK